MSAKASDKIPAYLVGGPADGLEEWVPENAYCLHIPIALPIELSLHVPSALEASDPFRPSLTYAIYHRQRDSFRWLFVGMGY